MLIVFLLLTLINLLIFFSRARFSYQSYSSYSALYAPCDPACNRKWKQFVYDYPRDHLSEAKKILDTAIDLKTTSTYDKILRIGNLLYSRFNKQRGKPSFEVLTAAPLDEFKMLSGSASAKLWCGNFSAMFAYFCWSEGITCRIIEIMNPGDHHVLNECYVPETNHWVMVDVTNNQLLVQNSSKQFLSLAEFRKALFRNIPLFATESLPGSIVSRPINTNTSYIENYYKKENPVYYYHRVNNFEIYKLPAKIKRYLLPVSWYEITDNKHHSNLLFYIKQVLCLLWLILFLLLLSRLIK